MNAILICIFALSFIGAVIIGLGVSKLSKLHFCPTREIVLLVTGIVIVFLACIFACLYDDMTHPSAIDVYRDNTELKIKSYIENGVVIKTDTIVVFKNTDNNKL